MNQLTSKYCGIYLNAYGAQMVNVPVCGELWLIINYSDTRWCYDMKHWMCLQLKMKNYCWQYMAVRQCCQLALNVHSRKVILQDQIILLHFGLAENERLFKCLTDWTHNYRLYCTILGPCSYRRHCGGNWWISKEQQRYQCQRIWEQLLWDVTDYCNYRVKL